MLILLTIFLFVLTSLTILFLRLVRPKLSIQGLLALLTVLAGLSMVFFARSDIPRTISLLQWKPATLFPISPSLLIDDVSWYFALALVSLTFSVVIGSIAQLGESTRLDTLPGKNRAQDIGPDLLSAGSTPSERTTNIEIGVISNWSFWSIILILTSVGLVAVTAGNLLTLLLAWTALDIIELVVLLSQVLDSKTRERVIVVFSAKIAGVVILLIAGLALWSHGELLSFDSISQATSLYLVLAAGLRLGVLPLQLPFTPGLPIRRGLGTALRLIPAASGYILLVRTASIGVIGVITPLLLGITTMAGLFAAINWMFSKDELDGRPYWLLGTASLAIASAVLNRPYACLAWSIACLLSGGFIFSMSIRHRNLLPLVILGSVNLSTLPFSPTWQGTTLYQYSPNSGVNITLFSVVSWIFLLIQSFLLAGFVRHSMRGLYPVDKNPSAHVERWVWFLYPFSLVIILLTQLFIGWRIYPNVSGLPLYGWIIGPVTLLITSAILYIAWRQPQRSPLVNYSTNSSFWNNLFSLHWLYRFLWKLFRSISNLFGLVSTILEGDAGILWALVLFALIFVFLQR
jgi:hypothetical protein